VATIRRNPADGWTLTHVGPVALARDHQTLSLKEAQSSASRCPADAIVGLELALRGKPAATGPLAASDLGTQLVGELTEEGTIARGVYRHARPASSPPCRARTTA
jgi:hypothetical protein